MKQQIAEELQTFTNDMLIAIIKGEVDMKELAKRELENYRGYNLDGKWVGFKK